MLRKLFGLAIAVFIPLAVAASVLTPRPVTISLPIGNESNRVAPVPPSHPESSTDPEVREEPTDLLGNTVTDAVARYKFDATGSLYEVHSPQTEVPRLRPPKT